MRKGIVGSMMVLAGAMGLVGCGGSNVQREVYTIYADGQTETNIPLLNASAGSEDATTTGYSGISAQAWAYKFTISNCEDTPPIFTIVMSGPSAQIQEAHIWANVYCPDTGKATRYDAYVALKAI